MMQRQISSAQTSTARGATPQQELERIQKQHQELLKEAQEQGPGDASSYITKVQALLDMISSAGENIDDASQRYLLGSLLRYWSNVINDKTDRLPGVQLKPFTGLSVAKAIGVAREAMEQLAPSTGSFTVSFVMTGILMPVGALFVTVILYFTPTLPLPGIAHGLYALLVGLLLTLVIWLLVAVWGRYFVSADGANTSSYSQLKSRLEKLQTSLVELGISTESLKEGTIKEPPLPAMQTTQESERKALNDALLGYTEVRQQLHKPNSAFQWILGAGYLNAWSSLHSAEGALIQLESVNQVIQVALHDSLCIGGSTISNSDELLEKQMQAVLVLVPDAWHYFSQKQREKHRDELLYTLVQKQTNDALHQLIQTLSATPNATPTDATTGGAAAKAISDAISATTDATIDTSSKEEKTASGGSVEQQVQARLVLREVRDALDDFRGQLWEGLIRARNHLLVSIFMIGLMTYLLLALTILTTPASSVISGALVFYLVGAIAGLFARLYRESIQSMPSIDDYGLALARLIISPLLSGLMGVGGVLVAAWLYTTFLDGNAIDPKSLQGIFSLGKPGYLLAAAIFGLAPDLLIKGLQQRSAKDISSLQATKAAQEG
jgi:hypothetical protein